MIALRPDDHIDTGLAAQNLRPFRLRNTTRYGDDGLLAVRSAVAFDLPHASQVRIDLLGRFLTNVARVEDDDIRILQSFGLRISERRKQVHHALAVIDVHLTAERLYVDFTVGVHLAFKLRFEATI